MQTPHRALQGPRLRPSIASASRGDWSSRVQLGVREPHALEENGRRASGDRAAYVHSKMAGVYSNCLKARTEAS